MKIDWTFVGTNLAKHLSTVAEEATMQRILEQARKDASRLSAPAGFWSLVASAYRQLELRAGRSPSEQVLEALRRSGEV